VSQRFLKFSIHVNPVPASRPRVSRWGTYYSKTYTAFRKAAPAAIEDAVTNSGVGRSDLPFSQPVECEFVFNLKRPKTTKLSHPRCDVDNLLKGIQDSIQGIIIVDDNQLLTVKGTKQWAKKGEEGSIVMKLRIVNS